jgi:hypothetical protein
MPQFSLVWAVLGAEHSFRRFWGDFSAMIRRSRRSLTFFAVVVSEKNIDFSKEFAFFWRQNSHFASFFHIFAPKFVNFRHFCGDFGAVFARKFHFRWKRFQERVAGISLMERVLEESRAALLPDPRAAISESEADASRTSSAIPLFYVLDSSSLSCSLLYRTMSLDDFNQVRQIWFAELRKTNILLQGSRFADVAQNIPDQTKVRLIVGLLAAQPTIDLNAVRRCVGDALCHIFYEVVAWAREVSPRFHVTFPTLKPA